MLRYGPVQVECMSCSMDCDIISRLFRVCNLTRVSTPARRPDRRLLANVMKLIIQLLCRLSLRKAT